MQLLERLMEQAGRRGESAALRWTDSAGKHSAVSFTQLAAGANAVAGRLSGLPLAGVVILCCPNRPEYTAAFLGILQAGLTVFPLTPELVTVELQSAAERSRAVAVIGGDTALAALNHLPLRMSLEELAGLCTGPAAPAADRSDQSGGLLLQSSGTTGLPKIVRRSVASLDAVSAQMVSACGFGPHDQVLAAVPLCHSYGVEHGLLAPTWAGSCVHLFRGFDLPLVLRELESGRITLFPGVPFMFEILAQTAQATGCWPSLRKAYSAGGPLPRSVYETCLSLFGVRVGQLYGATEIGSVLFNDPDSPHFDPAAVGMAMEQVSVRILGVDEPRLDQPLPAGVEGQVAVAAASMLSEYVGEAPPPLVGGHFLTGDLGRLSPEGVLTLTGRLKLLIDVGGLKVNPLEVEAVLCQHPAVAECVVVPMQISATVKRLRAVVRAKDHATVTPAELRAFARQRLSGYKVPRVIELRDALPRSAAGKILREQVRCT